MNDISSPKNILTNATKVVFVIGMFAIKNVVNAFKKNIILNVKSTQVKNLTRNVKKCHQNALHQVITLI